MDFVSTPGRTNCCTAGKVSFSVTWSARGVFTENAVFRAVRLLVPRNSDCIPAGEPERMAGMKKQFIFEFEDGSAKVTGDRHDSMSTDYYSGDEILRISGGGDTVPFVSGNSSGLIALGKFLIQIGMSEYRDGFHVHIEEDFNADRPEILIVGVNNSH